jgi:hypothetical protein
MLPTGADLDFCTALTVSIEQRIAASQQEGEIAAYRSLIDDGPGAGKF